MLTENEILNNKIPLKEKDFMGVYFLIQKNKIVYVGSSLTVIDRINTHRNNNRMLFDSWFYIKHLDEEKMRFEEYQYILTLKPRYNVQYNSDYENDRMILFATFRKRYKSLFEFSNDIGISMATLNCVFDLKKKVKQEYIDKVRKFLYPNGISDKTRSSYRCKSFSTQYKPKSLD